MGGKNEIIKCAVIKTLTDVHEMMKMFYKIENVCVSLKNRHKAVTV